MKLQKTITVLSTTLLLGSSVMLATLPAYAADVDDTISTKVGPFSGLIQFFEKKFNLDHDQVQAAVTEYHTQQKQTRLTNMANMEKKRLDRLVASGKITSAQEQAIIAELASLKTKYKLGNNTNETPDQRKANIQSFQNDLKAWASSQNIDVSLIEPGNGKGWKMGMRGRGMGMWGKPTTTLSPTPTK